MEVLQLMSKTLVAAQTSKQGANRKGAHRACSRPRTMYELHVILYKDNEKKTDIYETPTVCLSLRHALYACHLTVTSTDITMPIISQMIKLMLVDNKLLVFPQTSLQSKSTLGCPIQKPITFKQQISSFKRRDRPVEGMSVLIKMNEKNQMSHT